MNEEQLQAYIRRLGALRKWTRERQDTEHMLTFREAAKRYRVSLDTVEMMAEDAELSYNIGGRTGAGIWLYDSKGDYTLEDTKAPA